MRDIDPRDGRVIEVKEFDMVVRCYRKRSTRRNRSGKRSKMVVRLMSPEEYEHDKLTQANKSR